MPLKNKTFLSNICLYTFLILGGGCTDEAGMENIGNTDRRIPLTISVTVSSYTAIDKKNTSVTRTPIENGYTTEFSDSDAIGIIQKQRTERAVGHLPPVIHTHCTTTTTISPMWHTILIGTALQSNETIKRKSSKTWQTTLSCNRLLTSPPPPPIPAAT